MNNYVLMMRIQGMLSMPLLVMYCMVSHSSIFILVSHARTYNFLFTFLASGLVRLVRRPLPSVLRSPFENSKGS